MTTFTEQMQDEFEQAWISAGRFEREMHDLYLTVIRKWGHYCFGDAEIAEFVIRTISARHPVNYEVRWLRAWYEFHAPHSVQLDGKILIPEIIYNVLKENSRELFQRYQNYGKVLQAPTLEGDVVEW